METNEITQQHIENEAKVAELTKQLEIQRRKRSFPTWGDTLAILGIFFLTQLITAALFMLLGWSGTPVDDITQLSGELLRVAEQDQGRTVLAWTLVSQSMMLFLVILYRAIRRGGFGSVRFSIRGFNPTILLWGFIMLVSLSVVMEPLLALFPEPPIPVGRGIYMIAAIVVVAPIFEELTCRGVILEAVRKRRGAWVACVVSSLIFGAMHVQPQLVVNAFAMGLILGYIYLRTGSIFAPIILHSINNLMAYIFILFNISQLSVMELVGNKNIYLIVYSVAVGVMILSVFSIAARLKRLDREDREKIARKEAEMEAAKAALGK